MSCLSASPSAVRSVGPWFGAVPGAGLRELGRRLGVPGGAREAVVSGCHPTWVSSAEIKCPALLAAALGGRQRSEQSVFLSPAVNRKGRHF